MASSLGEWRAKPCLKDRVASLWGAGRDSCVDLAPDEAPIRSMLSKLRAHPVLTTAFVIATVLALFLLTRIVVNFVYWQTHQNEPIRPWMTVRYIDRSWDLTPGTLDAVAGLPEPREGKPLTLREIAEMRDVPVEEVIAQVEAALVELGHDPAAAEGSIGKPVE